MRRINRTFTLAGAVVDAVVSSCALDERGGKNFLQCFSVFTQFVQMKMRNCVVTGAFKGFSEC